jgi:hypothetical protein
MAEDILELFSKYQDELKKDVNVDELNMKESALTIATIKHKWAGRLMRHKVDLNRTEKAREKAVSAIVEQMSKDPSIQLSGPALRKKAESHERIKEVDQAIENMKLIIEYLEKIEKIVGSMTWDIKNIIDIVKIETQ